MHVIGDIVEFELVAQRRQRVQPLPGHHDASSRSARSSSSVLIVREAAQRDRPRGRSIGYVLVLGGALGNLSDRFFRSPGFLRGHVVDFVAVGWCPVFNVADSCITIGAILLIVAHAAYVAGVSRRRETSA